jgi:hypothetical protein
MVPQQQQQQQQQPMRGQQGTISEAGPRSSSSSSGSEDIQDAEDLAANPQQVGRDPFASSGQGGQQQRGRSGRTWAQKLPYQQCSNTTLTFDVSFIGGVQQAQVGESEDPLFGTGAGMMREVTAEPEQWHPYTSTVIHWRGLASASGVAKGEQRVAWGRRE